MRKVTFEPKHEDPVQRVLEALDHPKFKLKGKTTGVAGKSTVYFVETPKGLSLVVKCDQPGRLKKERDILMELLDSNRSPDFLFPLSGKLGLVKMIDAMVYEDAGGSVIHGNTTTLD